MQRGLRCRAAVFLHYFGELENKKDNVSIALLHHWPKYRIGILFRFRFRQNKSAGRDTREMIWTHFQTSPIFITLIPYVLLILQINSVFNLQISKITLKKKFPKKI